MWYDCQRDNYPQETKVTQTLTTIGHRIAFNNEQIDIGRCGVSANETTLHPKPISPSQL